MELPPELAAQLRQRVELLISLEAAGDAAGWYNIVDLAIRESCQQDESRLSSIKDFMTHVQSARIDDFVIDGHSAEGGAIRQGATIVARVITLVTYNQQLTPARFRTLWVLRDGEWYTRATGKLPGNLGKSQ